MSDTHFGFSRVAAAEKAKRVAAVFHSVASRYDVMNDLMSLGLHRLWKRFAVAQTLISNDTCVLDLAGGTADMALLIAKKMNNQGKLVLADINASMLRIGRDRLINHGKLAACYQCNAEKLPFVDRYFDLITVSFGLRNMTDKAAALREMHRVLRPGGQLLILEFSKTIAELEPCYHWYLFNILPWLGKNISGDEASYRYLAESILMHLNQEELSELLVCSGFEDVKVHNLCLGIVALHQATRYSYTQST